MSLRRRNFIALLLGAFLPIELFAQVLRRNNAHSMGPGEMPQLFGTNRIILAQSRQAIHLPRNPKIGQCVHISIQASSLSDPARIVYEGVPIIGFKEDVILDSLAIIRLEYLGSRRGWDFTSTTQSTFLG